MIDDRFCARAGSARCGIWCQVATTKNALCPVQSVDEIGSQPHDDLLCLHTGQEHHRRFPRSASQYLATDVNEPEVRFTVRCGKLPERMDLMSAVGTQVAFRK